MDAREVEQVVQEFVKEDFNEADTRHQFIDVLLHDVLGWPRGRVRCETKVHRGYSDYVLSTPRGEEFFIIEAKRKGVYFNIPVHADKDVVYRMISMSSLITDTNINAAVKQVVNYAVDLGAEFAAVTNGAQWIIFRPFFKGRKWTDLKAIVIEHPRWFYERYTEFFNLLSFAAVTQKASLNNALKTENVLSRDLYYPKSEVQSFQEKVTHNQYARHLRPIAAKFFRNLEDADAEDFFARCYVQERAQQEAFEGMTYLLRDSLSPYFEEFNVQQTEDNVRGGKLGNRIIKSLKETKSSDVVVLFGGKGIGKSTFLRRLLVHEPPQFLSKHAVVVRIDLLHEPDDIEKVREFIWKRLVKELDQDSLLESDQEDILGLFRSKFEIHERQVMVGLEGADRAKEIAAFIKKCKLDLEYTAQALNEYWARKHKGVVVVIDNTDQYQTETQDFCFQMAQKISSTLDCLSLISMREERFQESRIHGLLDAFQNSGYHLSTPLPDAVFLSRIAYVDNVLNDNDLLSKHVPSLHPDARERQDLIRFFQILENEFRAKNDSPLFMFLVSCAHGNIRLALELFRGFLVSGYTNVREMVSVSDLWTIKIHQVVRPLLSPNRFFYEEKDSQIPNVYQIRSKQKGSHFTAIRVIKRLSSGADPNNPHYVPIAELAESFISEYDLREEFYDSMSLLLRYGLIESSTKVDKYIADISEVKVTQYGMYFIESILHQFPYLDLVCTDCGYYSESVSHEIADLANQDYLAFKKFDRSERIEVRLRKVQAFLSYLLDQEKWERANYGIIDEDLIVQDIKDKFESIVPAIRASAKKNIKKRGPGGR